MSKREDLFDGWQFHDFEALLIGVEYRTGCALIAALKREISEMFDDFVTWGCWDYETPWIDHHGSGLHWRVRDYENSENTFGIGGLPVTIKASPDDIVSAFQKSLPGHTNRDGMLGDDTRATLLASLNDWRAAIDRAEQVLRDHP